MFWSQVVATVIAGTVQLGVQAWMFTNVKDMCSPTQSDGFTCPSTQVFGTASIIWGVIGPARQFSPGQIYYGLVFFFLAGFLAPVITRLIQSKFHNTVLKYINWPVIFSGTGSIPPATPSNYVTWSVVGFLFNYVIRRRHFAWWTKYNCASCSRSSQPVLCCFTDLKRQTFSPLLLTLVSPSRPWLSSSACPTPRTAPSVPRPSRPGGATPCIPKPLIPRRRRCGHSLRARLSGTSLVLVYSLHPDADKLSQPVALAVDV